MRRTARPAKSKISNRTDPPFNERYQSTAEVVDGFGTIPKMPSPPSAENPGRLDTTHGFGLQLVHSGCQVFGGAHPLSVVIEHNVVVGSQQTPVG
jgi:hypothetical protein